MACGIDTIFLPPCVLAMDPIDKIEVDGYTYWRVTPLAEVNQAYAKIVFNPGIWGMGIALYSVALWLALDLIFQVHVTFRRWSGIYYWSVLITSLGVLVHASTLIVKNYCALTMAEDIGTTVLAKAGDVLTQSGFSLVLYSRLNLVMRTQKQSYLKWILIVILVSSFLVHTPAVVITFGVNTGKPVWFQHARVAEKFVVLWFLLLELALSTIYTYNTARLSKDSSILLAHSALKNQSKKMRRNLLLFMIFAQIITFIFDLTLVVLVMMELRYKGNFMPFFYGVKLKVEFMALNQLQSLVQPSVNMFVFSGDAAPPNQQNGDLEKDGIEELGLHHVEGQDLGKAYGNAPCDDRPCPASKDSESALAPAQSSRSPVRTMVHTPMVQISQVSSTGSITELERQYLGRHNK